MSHNPFARECTLRVQTWQNTFILHHHKMCQNYLYSTKERKSLIELQLKNEKNYPISVIIANKIGITVNQKAPNCQYTHFFNSAIFRIYLRKQHNFFLAISYRDLKKMLKTSASIDLNV